MEIIYLLIPLSLVLIGVIVWAFFWAVRSGQFDDLEGPAHRILMDDDSVEAGSTQGEKGETTTVPNTEKQQPEERL
ncbi:MAG: cbb3-type cytochrome oxidase assembly protein CcoS [Pseudomonadota bacterium]